MQPLSDTTWSSVYPANVQVEETMPDEERMYEAALRCRDSDVNSFGLNDSGDAHTAVLTPSLSKSKKENKRRPLDWSSGVRTCDFPFGPPERVLSAHSGFASLKLSPSVADFLNGSLVASILFPLTAVSVVPECYNIQKKKFKRSPD